MHLRCSACEAMKCKLADRHDEVEELELKVQLLTDKAAKIREL